MNISTRSTTRSLSYLRLQYIYPSQPSTILRTSRKPLVGSHLTYCQGASLYSFTGRTCHQQSTPSSNSSSHKPYVSYRFHERHTSKSKHCAQTHRLTTTAGKPVHNHTCQLQSSFGNWSTILALGIATSLYVLYSYVTPNDQAPSSVVTQEDRVLSQESLQLDIAAMTGELLPGRPGNLTPEEEAKLLEMWTQIFQLFGVMPGSAKASLDTAHPDAADIKKKRGLFGRKKKEESSEDDKFGLQKAYNDAVANTSPEVLRSTMWAMVKHDHPDALLLRFLRARKWDVEKAVIMMIATMNWRATQMHVDDVIMKNGELHCLESEQEGTGATKTLGHDVLAQMRMGKSFIHGHDRENRPMCYVRARLHKAGEQSDESLEWYTVYLIETTRMMLAPPVDTACIVFDLTGFSLANMDYTPVKFMIKCFEANYPESLGAVIVYKAPWVFQGIWRIIKGLLDPVVAAKVNFANTVEEMEVFVERSKIPRELGGDEAWTYNFVEPVPGENKRMDDVGMKQQLLTAREEKVREFEALTKDWINGGGDNKVRGKREVVAQSLREGYWKLDPYIRARSMYDRVGTIGEGGVLSFYPGEKLGAVNGRGEKVVDNAMTAAPVGFQHSVDDID